MSGVLELGIKMSRGAERNDLLGSLDQVAEACSDVTAIYLRDPRVRTGPARYLALNFDELVEERDAWVQRLKSCGVVPDDKVLVWLPMGLSFLAATYALFKIGADVAIVSDALSLAEQCRALKQFEPTALIGTSAAVAKAKRRVADPCLLLEVKSPLLRLAGVVKSDCPRAGSGGSSSSLTLFGERGAARFGRSELSAMVDAYREGLRIGKAETDVPTCPLLALFNAALGVSTVALSNEFQTSRRPSASRVLEAIKDLSVTRLTRTESQWRGIVREVEAKRKTYPELQRAYVSGAAGAREELAEDLRKAFPEAIVSRLFGTRSAPIASIVSCDDRDLSQSREYDAQRKGACIGRLLPGVRDRIEAPNRKGTSATNRVGELVLEGPAVGKELQSNGADGKDPQENLGSPTGYYAYADLDGRIWLCGDKQDVVRTGFGTFVPARCEPVFEAHEVATRVALISLYSRSGARPGLVVELDSEAMPRDAIAASKLKAELLRLGAAVEETKLILDIFFTAKLPERRDAADQIDRESLSRRYSLMARLKSVF